MDIVKKNNVYIVDGSVIDFVITGPKGRRDGIIIKSVRLGPDMLAHAIDTREGRANRRQSRSDRNFLFPMNMLAASRVNILNDVDSHPVPQFGGAEDQRLASFTFVWSGGCNSEYRKLIEGSFNNCIVDLLKALDENEQERIEMSLAPLLFICMKANDRSNAISRFLLIYMGIIVGTAAIAMIAALASAVPRFLFFR